ncbi:MAG: hypothetical protein WAN36_11995 [Calditrichia bacterium]
MALRKYVERGNIFGAYQQNNYFWFIRRIQDYSDIITAKGLTEILELKNRTSLYRKIKHNEIPVSKTNSNMIYFKVSELLSWAMEKNQPEVYEKLQHRYKADDLKQHLEKLKTTIKPNHK